MARRILLGGLLTIGLAAAAAAQPERVSVPLRGFASERSSADVNRYVRAALGNPRDLHVTTRVYPSSEKTIDWQVRSNGSFPVAEVQISSAKLAELLGDKLPFSAGELQRIVQASLDDARRKVDRLVAEQAEFYERAGPEHKVGERLKLLSGLYPELGKAAEAYARAQLGKTTGEWLLLDTEIERGQHKKAELKPIEGQVGSYRLVVSQASLAEIAKAHFHPASDYLANRLDARWRAKDPGENRPLERQRHEVRFEGVVSASAKYALLEAEVRQAFEAARGEVLAKTSNPDLQQRLRTTTLSTDFFAEEGVRARAVEWLPRGHVEDLLRGKTTLRADMIHVETFELMERLEAKGWGDAQAKQARIQEFKAQIEAELSKGIRSIKGDSALRIAERLNTDLAAKELLDRVAPYRRADKTVDWKRAMREGALRHGGGAVHFALALFLKELAVTVKTGDKQRIEEFFDFLTTTDFFVHYGLFAAGAQAGEIAYSRFLARHVRSTFVGGILRTNIVLATGMALPELLSGNFDGRTFAIHLGSLGLSATAVKTGLEGIRWVTNLKRAEQAGRLTRAATGIRRLARVGGWFYTVAETAVVLYLGDEIAKAVTEYLDEEAARDAVGEATKRFLGRTLDPDADERALQEALGDFGKAHADYRNFLYQRLSANDQTYAARLARASRKAKLLEDRRQQLRDRLERLPALRQRALARYDSIDDYLDAQLKDEEAALREGLDESMRVFEETRRRELKEIYTGELRDEPYVLDLSNPERVRWIAEGMKVGERADPYAGRTDFFAGQNRGKLERDLLAPAREVSSNRFQAYEDELAVLGQVRAQLPAGKRAAFDERIALLGQLRDQETQLVGTVIELGGIADRLRQGR